MVLISSIACGQQADKNGFRGAGGNLSFGVGFIDFTSLNSDLKALDMPVFNKIQGILDAGLTGGAFIKRFYLGGGGSLQFGASASDERYDSKYTGGYGMLKAGYTLIDRNPVIVYPTIGFGGGGQNLRIESKNSPDGNLPTMDNNIHAGYMLIDFGINADLITPNKDDEGQLVLGLSLGYKWKPWVGGWEFDGQHLQGFDKFYASGLYVKLNLGWGTFNF